MRSAYGAMVVTGSMPIQVRCEGSQFRYRPRENIHSHSSGE
jgi:hypothetical protein